MSRTWTENQARAIAVRERDVCVAAGAGSGKTGVLVERFVRIVRDGVEAARSGEAAIGVNDILVITFTDKATREMKGRIAEELMAAGLLEQRREVETAYISTIHGFCSRLLKENPFEAGVDPEFGVLDETEARRLLRAAFEGVIERAYLLEDAEIMELVAAAQDERVFGSDLHDPLAALADGVEATLRRLRGAGRRLEEIEALWRTGRDAAAARSLAPVRAALAPVVNELIACVEALRMLRAGVSDALELRRRAVIEQGGALAPLPEAVDADGIAETLAAIREMEKEARVNRGRSGGAPDEGEIQAIFERIRQTAEAAKSLHELVAEREEEAALLCHRFWGLVAATWESYTEAKRAQGMLDNEDLQSEAVRLLETAPAVLRRYHRRFRYLMVDEFQDTDPLQMRLIDLLHLSGGGEERNGSAQGAYTAGNHLFVVGDVQQSIYGFRNADATLFQDLERKFRTNGAGEHVSLAANFRSRPEILRLVNRLFGQIWRNESTAFTPLETGANYTEKRTSSIELLLARDTGRHAYLALEADALAARIRQMVETQELTLTDRDHPRCGEPVGYRDIAVLLRSLPDIEKYEAAFLRREVPYFVVGGGRGYYARHEVRDVLNVLTVLDTPLDDVALAATLRSPMVGADVETLYALVRFARSGEASKGAPLYPAIPAFLESGPITEDEAARLRRFYETIESLRAQEDRLPVGHLLERLLQATEYDARLLVRPNGKRRLANVRKLLQMAYAASIHGVADFIRRLREIEKLSDREGDAPTEEEAADVVRLITIHKAKGLEFPVVFLADMARPLLHPYKSVFLCDPKALAMGCKLGEYKTAAYRAIAEVRERADRDETARLLYVALTRAREHLGLCGSVQGKQRPMNWADAVFPQLGVLSAPEELETRVGPDGVTLRVIPMNALV